MRYFIEGVVKPFVLENNYRQVCEIGAHHGEATKRLLDASNVAITIVDPCIDEDLVSKFGADGRVTVRRGLSLNVLNETSTAFDCILIDGDHNWYTVFNELRIIDEKALLCPGGAILLHDIRWPYARRDMYYDPSAIPQNYTHPYARQGMIKGESALSPDSGHLAGLNNALVEGGPRNGVLTAIEDFLKLSRGKYIFMKCPVEYGLAIIVLRAPGIDLIYQIKWQLRFLMFAANMRLMELRYVFAAALECKFPTMYRMLTGLRRRIG